MEPSSGSHIECLAKLHIWYQYTNIDVVSVMGAYAAITLTSSILVHWYQICNFS